MADPQESEITTEAKSSSVNPLKFTPLLYLTQAMPVALVQEVSTLVFSTMGYEKGLITYWTSLIAFPWAMQMLLGPFVEFTGTKRKWILTSQLFIAIALIALIFALRMPNPFYLSIGVMAVTAIFSALCNIATDGFYILSLTKAKQAKFIGINSTFFRLGRLFMTGILVTIAGGYMAIQPLNLKVDSGYVNPALTGKPDANITDCTLLASGGKITLTDTLTKEQVDLKDTPVPEGTKQIVVDANGAIIAVPFRGEPKEIAKLILRESSDKEVAVVSNRSGNEPLEPGIAWSFSLMLLLAIYGLSRLTLGFSMPVPAMDVDRGFSKPVLIPNLIRTLSIVGVVVSLYVAAGNAFRLLGHVMANAGLSSVPIFGSTETWKLDAPGLQWQFIWLSGMLVAFGVAFVSAKSNLKGTDMAESFSTYIRQDRFPAILFFIAFYRLAEILVSRITTFFLTKPTSEGALGIATQQFGIVNGTIGVIGIVVGGIVGGILVSKWGLRKSFIPLALAMHVPNLMYLFASLNPGLFAIPADLPQAQLPLTSLSFIVFFDQMGYGIGFAAYMVYLMWVAQRGKYQTSHYAIGTGLGALFIMASGLLSAKLIEVLSYSQFFVMVLIVSIPSMLSLWLIPLDDKEGRNIKLEEIVD